MHKSEAPLDPGACMCRPKLTQYNPVSANACRNEVYLVVQVIDTCKPACAGQEVTQYTYFQQAAGLSLPVPSVEITYGLERIMTALQVHPRSP
jgi:hypothetical protein